MANVQARLARNLRSLREQKGLSQEAFAEELGLHRTYVSHLERGTRNPGILLIERIAEALGVSTCELLH